MILELSFLAESELSFLVASWMTMRNLKHC